MNKIKLILYICFLITYSVIGQVNDDRLQNLDQDIEKLISRYKAVGLAVAVVEEDSIIYSKGFGFRNREKGLKMNSETLLPIGSATKSFTSTVLGILEHLGKLSVKDKPVKYISNLRFFNSEMDNNITIEDLLCHKSGMGSFDGSNTFFPTKKPEEFIPRFRYLKPNGAIKNSFIYSNVGFGIAGLIIQKASKETWESAIQNKIFKPLDMTRSTTNIQNMEKDMNHGIGYGLSEGAQVKLLNRNFTFSKPEGAVISSVNEMANYLISWLNNGKYKGKQVIPAEFINEATSIKNIIPQNYTESNREFSGYGYGWFVQSQKGRYKVQHGGNVPGFSTQMATFPNEKVGIIVITNQNNSALPYLVEDLITNRMFRLPRTAIEDYDVQISEIWNKVREINPENNKQKPTHPYREYCGTYSEEGHGTIHIRTENDMLFIKFPEYEFVLEHRNFNNFVMVNTYEIPEVFGLPYFGLSFQIDFDGNISSLTLEIQSEPVKFIKQ
ncbi:serine hydrolase [Patiriisocius hiemis]|uniref:Serine hydrolase n=1 Tax=Patiriisocius hiemis TaxID=3075604 RepID=A0ABU2YBP4_9FLAO|nr:serine hydrolase [Constantimarinum sp. W242]MDT0554650.1 serine hydrolase [Constantimarinum sp. W242]